MIRNWSSIVSYIDNKFFFFFLRDIDLFSKITPIVFASVNSFLYLFRKKLWIKTLLLNNKGVLGSFQRSFKVLNMLNYKYSTSSFLRYFIYSYTSLIIFKFELFTLLKNKLFIFRFLQTLRLKVFSFLVGCRRLLFLTRLSPSDKLTIFNKKNLPILLLLLSTKYFKYKTIAMHCSYFSISNSTYYVLVNFKNYALFTQMSINELLFALHSIVLSKVLNVYLLYIYYTLISNSL